MSGWNCKELTLPACWNSMELSVELSEMMLPRRTAIRLAQRAAVARSTARCNQCDYTVFICIARPADIST